MNIALLVAAVLGGAVGAARWLRVAQREHYLAPSTTLFAARWWRLDLRNRALALLAVAAAGASFVVGPAGFVTAAIVAIAPLGLNPCGRTSKLAWTRRLRTVAVAVLLLAAIAIGVGALFGVAGPLDSVIMTVSLRECHYDSVLKRVSLGQCH